MPTSTGERQGAISLEALPAPAAEAAAPESAAAKADAAAAPALTWREAVRAWIDEHDHSWIFVAVYLGLAVVLSVFVSLFWLVFMASVHLLLEYVRHRRPDRSAGRIFAHSLWEVKLDFALVVLALGMVLYVDVVLGILGIQSAARAAAVTRAGARAASRIAAWERNLRGFLVTVDEMVRIGRAVFMLRRGKPAEILLVRPVDERPWRREWGLGDRISVGILAACTLLILAAPLLTSLDAYGVLATLLQELRPLPA